MCIHERELLHVIHMSVREEESLPLVHMSFHEVERLPGISMSVHEIGRLYGRFVIYYAKYETKREHFMDNLRLFSNIYHLSDHVQLIFVQKVAN